MESGAPILDVARCVAALRRRWPSAPQVAVAFSGGVDSTLLLRLCVEALGPSRVTAVTAVSPSLPEAERAEAALLARAMGVVHRQLATEELADARYRSNDRQRCYHCKAELFGRMRSLAPSEGWDVLVFGATADDLGDHRPGMQAARDHGIQAPLIDLGLGKAAIRALSASLGLSTADKPAMACLASRIPYGSEVTAQKLAAVERAEGALRALGLRELRVRHHEAVARLEVGAEEWPRAAGPLRAAIDKAVKAAGFAFVALDLEPFRSGRMNDGPAAQPADHPAIEVEIERRPKRLPLLTAAPARARGETL